MRIPTILETLVFIEAIKVMKEELKSKSPEFESKFLNGAMQIIDEIESGEND